MDFSAACLDGMLGGGGLNNSSNNGNGNGHRLCRSASEMDLEQTSRDQDWRSSSSASIKMARTDSFPTLMRSSSVISDASAAARMENNNNSSAASDLLESAEAAMLMRSDSVVSPYRTCLPFYHHHHQQQQQPHQTGGYQYANNNSNKPPSGLPLSIGRLETMNSAGMHAILAGTRSPFTPSQWQELEQQALIFKYMMAGVAVPPDLLIPLRRNINIFSSLPVTGSTLRSNLGWSSFHLGYAANNADPEPGRCRRTDGKKWRCSRDAVPDQKYCERHMNRGRHRSRKPVEGQTPHHHQHSATAHSSSTSGAANNSSSASSLAAAAARSAVTATTTTTTTSATSATASSTSSHTNLLRSSISTHQQQQQQQIGTKLSVFPASLSAAAAGGSPAAASVSPFQIPLNVDRYLNGMKGDIEGPMFESSSQSINGLSMLSSMNNAWGSRNMVPAKTTSNNNGMMSYETRTLIDDGGQDFGLLNHNQMSSLLSMTQNQNNVDALQGFGNEDEQRGIRHNFFDDWPRTSRDRSTAISWTEMERMRSSTSSSATKLSISIPSEFDSPGSPRCDKLMLSPLKLSMSRDADPLGIDPTTQMGLGMGMGMGMGLGNQTSEQCRQKQTNWIPITWESPVGGPLAEVLNSTKDCNVKNSALNLMTDGWDCSPRGRDSSRMASPTGVLQKTFGSLSDSSTGSSPRAVHVAKVAHDSAGLCENLRTVTFVTGVSAPISTT